MRNLLLKLSVTAALALPLAPSRARAQVTAEPSAAVLPVTPNPANFARGLYTEGELGGLAFFGKAGDVVGPGFAIGARCGYDLTRWLAVQLHALGSTHQIRGGGPTDGQLLQTYQGTAEARLTLRFVQTALFAEAGAGLARLSTNILYVLGLERYRTGFTAGGSVGFDYHSLSRHFSVGVRGGYFWLREVSGSQDLVATTYLRYTF